jgi:hypothetical protein
LPLCLALLRAVKEGNQLVDDGFSVRLRRDLGGDQMLGLDADCRVGDKAGLKPILRVLSSRFAYQIALSALASGTGPVRSPPS